MVDELKKLPILAVCSMLGWLSARIPPTQREWGERKELGCVFGGQSPCICCCTLVSQVKSILDSEDCHTDLLL